MKKKRKGGHGGRRKNAAGDFVSLVSKSDRR
jgi:hypothetical protein